MRFVVLSLFMLCFFTHSIQAQKSVQTDTLKYKLGNGNVQITPISHDSLCSSFVLFIEKGVALHKHAFHTEQVYVLEGEGIMQLGKDSFEIRPGNIIQIPVSTPHSVRVTGNKPLKVISIQSPRFDGSDRILITP